MPDQFVVSSLLTCFTSLFLSIFVYLKNPKRGLINRVFILYNFSLAFWSFGFFKMITAENLSEALLWSRLLHLGAIFIPVTFLHFVFIILDIASKRRNVITECYLFGIALSLICFTDIFVINPVAKFNFKYFVNPGPIYHIFTLFFFSLIAFNIIVLFKEYIVSSGSKRNMIKYLFLAHLIGYTGGGSAFLPLFNIPAPFWGLYLIPICMLIVAYLIIRYRLLNINIALTRAGIFAFVYTIVLGIPFILGYRYKLWKDATWITLILATIGPFTYNYLRNKAENIILKDQRRYQQTLLRASQGMTLIKELNKLLKLIVHILTKSIKLRYAAIYMFDKNTNTYQLKIRRGDALDANTLLSPDEPLLKFILEYKKPITQESLDESSNARTDFNLAYLKQEMRDISAVVIVPSIIENNLLAFLVLGEKISGHHYTEDDLNIFSILANHASLAIENALFYEETGKTLAEKFHEHRLWAIGKMGSGIGHQINNRFNAVTVKLDAARLIELEKLKSISKKDEEKKLLKAIENVLISVRDDSLKGGEIATSLTNFSRKSEEYKFVLLEDVIKGALAVLSCKFNINVLNLKEDYPKDTIKLYGNFSQLQDVFMNLMDNANDAMHKKQDAMTDEKQLTEYTPQITINASQKDRFWNIQVKDNGSGMKEEDVNQLFIPFFTTKGADKGTGLGLSIIKQIIEAHGGSIKVESVYGKETTFNMSLPLKKEEAQVKA